VTRAEVVDRDAHADVVQLHEHTQRPLGVGHRDGLGDLEAEPRWVDGVIGDVRGDVSGSVGSSRLRIEMFTAIWSSSSPMHQSRPCEIA
jgi:hypothetical protein